MGRKWGLIWEKIGQDVNMTYIYISQNVSSQEPIKIRLMSKNQEKITKVFQ